MARLIELTIQDAESCRVLQIQSSGTILARIGKLHVVERIEELGRECKPNRPGDARGLGEGEVQVPAMLAIERAEIIGPTIDAENHGPEHVIDRLGVGKQIYAGAFIADIAVAPYAPCGSNVVMG